MILRVGDADVGYDDIGQGAPLVLCHAFPLDRTMWAPQTSALAAHYRCLTLDTRGFGESTATPPFSVDRYADDVAAVLDAAGLDRVVVVGLSMGGYVAFALWRRHRQRVRALVLADTRAAADTADAKDRRRELIELARTAGPKSVAERQLVGLLGKTTRERRPDIVASARVIMNRASVAGIVAALEALMARPDSTPMLPTISVPTLVIVGDEDAVAQPKEARAMHAAIPGSRIEVLGGAGHLSSMERPAAFNAVLSEFLVALESRDAGSVSLQRMSSPTNATSLSAAEQTRSARIGGMLFRNRSWLPVLFLGVPLLVPGHMSATGWIIGALAIITGEWVRLAGVAAAGTVTRRRSRTVQRLVTYGVFAWVRNPLYVGNFLIWMGFVVISGVLWFLPIAIVIFAIEYSLIVRYEEGVLESIFGAEYLGYKQTVPRWLPRPSHFAPTGPHNWTEAWKSETSTFLQYLVLVLLFVFKEWRFG